MTGYRVDIQLTFRDLSGKETGRKMVEYTSLKNSVTLEMAQSLAEHLKRNKTGGRIVSFSDNSIVEEWESSGRQISGDARSISG